MITLNTQVTKKELSIILNVSYKTALKRYQCFIDILNPPRCFLTFSDLEKLDISYEMLKNV